MNHGSHGSVFPIRVIRVGDASGVARQVLKGIHRTAPQRQDPWIIRHCL